MEKIAPVLLDSTKFAMNILSRLLLLFSPLAITFHVKYTDVIYVVCVTI